MLNFQESNYTKEILEYQLPRYHEIPDIDLYMDQVVSLMHKYLDVFEGDEKDKFITSNMINNYVKQKLLPKPTKKKYNRDHIACLLIICLLKQILSINEIQDFFSQIKENSIEETYDYLCNLLEQALKDTFNNVTSIEIDSTKTKILHACALAFSNKIYIQKYLTYLKERNSQKE